VAEHSAEKLFQSGKPDKAMTELQALISAKGQKRIERIPSWSKEFESAEDLLIEVDAITSNLRFGVIADDFEAAVDRLGKALGLAANRPDKELRERPDNLWALRDDLYWTIECKTAKGEACAGIHGSRSPACQPPVTWVRFRNLLRRTVQRRLTPGLHTL
jgi:hypothetical protein